MKVNVRRRRQQQAMKAVESELARGITSRSIAASVATSIYFAQAAAGETSTVLEDLKQRLIQQVGDAELGDVTTHQLRYASDLARAPGELMYEEMRKLLALCDAAFALEQLGFSAPAEMWDQLRSVVVRRVRQQRALWAMAAQDMRSERDAACWWWYREDGTPSGPD